jgi:WD40 repeat protein
VVVVGRASGRDEDGVMRVFDRETGRQRFARFARGVTFRSVSASSDGLTLVLGGGAGEAYSGVAGRRKEARSYLALWDVERGQAVRELSGHRVPVSAVAFSPNGKVVAAGGVDGVVCLW